MIKVEVRVDDIGNVVRGELELGQLADKLFAWLCARDKGLGDVAQATLGVVDALTVYARVKDHIALGMGNQIARYRNDKLFTLLVLRKKYSAVEFEKSNWHGKDLKHTFLLYPIIQLSKHKKSESHDPPFSTYGIEAYKLRFPRRRLRRLPLGFAPPPLGPPLGPPGGRSLSLEKFEGRRCGRSSASFTRMALPPSS